MKTMKGNIMKMRKNWIHSNLMRKIKIMKKILWI
jgi:hypothetical protein